MEDLDKIVEINNLFDLYKNLLTEKQKEYFIAFYQENMSLSEIAENYSVSRNAVYSQLNLTKKSLLAYEEKLELYKKQQRREVLIEKIKKSSNDKLAQLLDELMEV